MAKKRSKRLQTVLRLAELRQQKAAEELGRAIQKTKADIQQSQQLQGFQQEYVQQFGGQSNMPVSTAQLENFQNFYGKLDSAIVTQGEQIVLSKGQQDQARKVWQEQYARQKSLEQLVEKLRRQEDAAQEGKLQRELDDRYARKKTET
jgi:flagellar FliJ protein